MKKEINVCGMACPKPVIEVKKALENEKFDLLEIVLDNEAAKENVSSLIKKLQFEILSISEQNGLFYIIIQGDEKKAKIAQKSTVNPDEHPCPTSSHSSKKIFILSDQIGSGSEELGKMLMKAYTFALTELPTKPSMLIFMNAGVKLCVDSSESLPNLRKLEQLGIPMFVCGTCLNFYQLQEKLAVGTISNMYDITENLFDQSNIITIS